jgi:Flp pilus assembly protein TadB
VTRRQAQFFIVCALVTLFAGLGIVLGSGPAFGWFVLALGVVNTVLGVLHLRKSSKPLS